MTYLVIILGFMAVVFAANLELDTGAIQKIHEIAGKCQSKTELSAADMEKILKHEVPENKSGKCFLECMKKSLGFMNPDNSMNLKLIRSRVNEHIKNPELKEKTLKIVDLCTNEVPLESDGCEMASKLMSCCVKHSHEMGISTLNLLGA